MPKFIVEYAAKSTSYDRYSMVIEAADKEAAQSRLEFTDEEKETCVFHKFINSEGHELVEIIRFEEVSE